MANNDMRKLSFAKVAAASASKNPPSTSTIARTSAPATAPAPAAVKDRRVQTAPSSAAPAIAPIPVAVPVPTAGPPRSVPATSAARDSSPAVQKPTRISHSAENKVVEGLKDLKLDTKAPNLVVHGSLSSIAERSARTGNSQTPSDDNSQRADSSSELGTKPPSLDGKSITSGTTFAMDEKESLRPDDSASVKAAAEDDDAFSVRGSYLAGSRMGSDVAARIHRIQIGDMPPRAITTHLLAANQSQGVATPQSGISEKQPIVEAQVPLVGGTATPEALTVSGLMSQNADEKLLEAMQSPKDRLFLLRLEQQVIEFVQDSKEPFMDLPPSNSFCRMLTHKLADYYHMTHSFEAVAGSVRIFRTPFCRIPPSLSSISVVASNSSSPAPTNLPRKIMRRGEEAEYGHGENRSKGTSDAGSDSKDKGAPAKEKLTREEREEAYNRARQRIFGSIEKTETSAPDGEDGNGVSRASSVSAKDRANGAGKRKTNKQRRDDSESFDSRSQYVTWFGQSTWAQAAPQLFAVNSSQFNGQIPQPYPNAIQSTYGGSNQPYPPMMPTNNGFAAAQYNGMTSYPSPPVPQSAPLPPPQPVQQQQQPQRYQPVNPPPMGAPYNSPVPAMPQPAWPTAPPQPPQAFNQPAAYAPAPPPLPPPPRTVMSASGIPYPYGQLPVNANPHDPKSQHPIPGSYNRQAFNPKTQSFVPANGMVAMQQQQQPAGPYGSSSSHHGSPQFNPSHMGSYNGYQQQQQQQPLPLAQPGYGPGPMSYGMTRQGSNNSMTPQYHPQQQQQQQHPQQQQQLQQPPLGLHHAPLQPHVMSPPSHHSHMPNKSAGGHQQHQHQQQTFSHLPNYGNPATLPQKPSL
ncbi:hypothetical protein B0T17DRAFT_50976 [Bombardia bombarda]|uniref:Uncharacterized protein n=1 Tax=Bombardia bombarda TaxID=252184 RepID=A0AA39XLU0_9PEZI|nr:hypothetical protein B0T17DRAFT_50976 [Bombardia bombarda]